MPKRSLFLAALMCLVVLAPAGAAERPQRQRADEPRAVFLNTYAPARGPTRPYTPSVGSQVLTANVPYVLSVRGTYSGWARERYRGKRCGRPEPRPMYPSPGRPNGRVGLDAEFVFGSAADYCRTITFPVAGTIFRARTDRDFFTPIPLRAPTAPRADHTYRYPLMGAGRRARFRLPDTFTADNYGRLRFIVREATPSDCTLNRFALWGYPDEATCMAAAQGAPPAS